MLHELRLQHYRCYAALRWQIPSEGAILYGDNAQGKTSILEAICIALSLHSPRSKRMDKLASHADDNPEKGFGIALCSDESERKVIWKNRQLQLFVHGENRHDHNEYLHDSLPVVWLGNRDIQLIIGAAEERRQYLDFLGTQWHPAYRQALLAYRKALRSRNALLKNPRSNRESLRSFARVLAQQGEILMTLRERMITRLRSYVKQSHRQIADNCEEIELHYRRSCEGPLEAAFQQSLESDLRQGFTSVGPHRDELQLLIQGQAAASYASEGQQRTLAIALQLGQANLLSDEKGRPPLMLIDDIFGELDPKRRQALLQHLPQESQIIITTTHLHWMEGKNSPLPLFHVHDAQISPISAEQFNT